MRLVQQQEEHPVFRTPSVITTVSLLWTCLLEETQKKRRLINLKLNAEVVVML